MRPLRRGGGAAAGLAAAVLLLGCPPPRSPRGASAASDPGALGVEVIPDPLYAAPLFTVRGAYARILFHLNLRNLSDRPLRLRRVTLIHRRAGREIGRQVVAAAALRERLRPAPWIVMRDRQTIAAAHRNRGLLRRSAGTLELGAGQAMALTGQHALVARQLVPDAIRCVVTHDRGRSQRDIPVLWFEQRTRLSLPVAGRWWVMGAHGFDEGHAAAILESQDFAYDLGVLGDNLSTHRGPRRDNASYFAYGQPVLAAADGTVVATLDGIPDNTPVGARPSWQMVLRQPRALAGNHVVLAHGAGEHTAYLHLKPGLEVAEGQRVRRGQVVGHCGNSGNSLQSHLHFQLQDGPDLLTANGLPARLSDLTLHLPHMAIHVGQGRAAPLPLRVVVEPGRAAGAAELERALPDLKE